MAMKKIAIIGASYLQEPLIQKAKSRGYETHVFAWKAGDVGEYSADHFYPISITEKEEILEQCRKIGIDAICSISSDLAIVTVNYVAEQMGLCGNSWESTLLTTNKHLMRKRFEEKGDPSPKSMLADSVEDTNDMDMSYPVIVKPLDRSGSRGITLVENAEDLEDAINAALAVGFEKKALIEEYVTGDEYSVEYISWRGKHSFLALTKKYTTGSPNFIETAHLEPADVDDEILKKIQRVVVHALDSLEFKNGASHSEVMVTPDGEIKLIEIGGRMGGDNIGSSLVELSTGYDFLGAVLDVSMGIEPVYTKTKQSCAGIRFVFAHEDVDILENIRKEHPDMIVDEDVHEITEESVSDSSKRFGYYTLVSDDLDGIRRYMPQGE